MRYFFSQAGAVQDVDHDGVELDSTSAARVCAVEYASETLSERPEIIWQGDEFRVEVTDQSGLILFTVIVLGIDAPATRSF